MQHCRDYCGAQNLLVVAVGTQSLNKIEKMVRKSFGQIPRAPKDAPDYSQMDLPFLGVPLSQCLTAYFHYEYHRVMFTGPPLPRSAMEAVSQEAMPLLHHAHHAVQM